MIETLAYVFAAVTMVATFAAIIDLILHMLR